MCIGHGGWEDNLWYIHIKGISSIQIIALWLLVYVQIWKASTWVTAGSGVGGGFEVWTCYLGIMLAIPKVSILLESSSRELQFGTKIKHKDSSEMNYGKICKNTKSFLEVVNPPLL